MRESWHQTQPNAKKPRTSSVGGRDGVSNSEMGSETLAGIVNIANHLPKRELLAIAMDEALACGGTWYGGLKRQCQGFCG